MEILFCEPINSPITDDSDIYLQPLCSLLVEYKYGTQVCTSLIQLNPLSTSHTANTTIRHNSNMRLIVLKVFPLIMGTAYATALPKEEPALEERTPSSLNKRDDCGKGYPPYTRRTNSPCSNPKDHTYCGCDISGIVGPIYKLQKHDQSVC